MQRTHATRVLMKICVSTFLLVGSPMFGQETAECQLDQGPDRVLVSNSRCQIAWQRTARGWSAEYQCRVGDQWQSVAYDDVDNDAAYGIVLPGDTPKNDRVRADIWGREYSALPPADQRPEVIFQSSARIVLRWSWKILDPDGRQWPVKSTFTMQQGDTHVHEKVEFSAPPKVATHVRYQRGWECKNVAKKFYESVAHTLTHTGWSAGGASFLILITRSDGWDGSRGGGGIVRMTGEKEWLRDQTGFHTPTENARYNVFHRAPHVLQKDGWIDTRYFDTYTIEHYLVMQPGSLFERGLLDYVDRLQPVEPLAPRNTWKKFLDLQVEGAQNVPGLFEDHGDWGHYELGWYHGFDPDRVHIQRDRQALDWGGNWDLWIALALRKYGQTYQHAWAQETSRKLINGVKHEMWQVQDPSTICDGAFWMFRPRSQEEYQKLRAAVPSGEQGGYIRSTSDLWISQTGKIGTLLCELYVDTKDEQVLAMARNAAQFLLRIQQPDGNLIAGRIHVNGTPVYPANLATNSCAIMLWSRFYEVTQDVTYRDAALRCAQYTIGQWLNGTDWRMYGGEWDVPGNISASSAAYATWAFAILYRATKFEPALDAVRWSADWHRMLQSRLDTHIGFYQQKAYWRGSDARSTGGFTQGVMDEGYGQLLWNRPEECYAQYLAWTVTQDRTYLDSAVQYLVWQTYMQHNCPYDYRFHGGASEGFEWQWDTLNGHGTVYVGETIGCDLTLFPLMEAGLLP